MKASELRTKSKAELQAELDSLAKAGFGLRMQLASGQSNKTDGLKKIRKDIARIKTILTEKAAEK